MERLEVMALPRVREIRTQLRRVLLRSVLVLLSFTLAKPALADKYALLVGVNNYKYLSEKSTLAGAVNDVVVLRQTLIQRGFKPDHIRLLIDERATKAAVLGYLNEMVLRARPGDMVVFYFSGHGTSARQKGQDQAVVEFIGDASGAIIPTDFDPHSPATALKTLIVGRTDLQPALKKLNPKATGIVILDSCFSQDAAKAILPQGHPRFIDIEAEVAKNTGPPSEAKGQRSLGEEQARQLIPDANGWDVLPYDNVVSLSAASRDETAADVRPSRPEDTVDGLPHGAFTSSLLKAFQSATDRHAGKVSIDQLFSYARSDVHRSGHPQTPQMLQPASRSLARELTFDFGSDPAHAQQTAIGSDGMTGGQHQSGQPQDPPPPPQEAPPPPPPPPPATVVRVSGIPNPMLLRIVQLRGVTLSDGPCDLFLIYTAPNFDLYDGAGSFLRSYSRDEVDALVDRISYDDQLRHLADQTAWKQDFDIHLEVTSPLNQGRFYAGQHLNIAAALGEPGYPIVFDIEPDGAISFLSTASMTAAPAGALQTLLEGKVQPPYGTDTLAIFAFRDKPEGYDRWVCHPNATGGGSCPRLVPGTEPFQEFMKFLTNRKGMAEASLRVSTSSSKYSLR